MREQRAAQGVGMMFIVVVVLCFSEGLLVLKGIFFFFFFFFFPKAEGSNVAFVACVSVIAQKRLAGNAKSSLLRELRVAMSLRHVNLNTMHGFNDFDRESFYIVEDFYDLGDCESLKRLNLRWPEPAVAKWVKDVLHALAFLHAKGVAYERLALSNIVLNHRGRVKLTCTALLSVIGADSLALAGNDAVDVRQTSSDVGIQWAVARSQFSSSRTRDILDFTIRKCLGCFQVNPILTACSFTSGI
jgi:serine/threonine protein kinase